MRTITVRPPEVVGQTVEFRWTVDPTSDLYARESFNLRFGPEVELGAIPADVWWLVAILCLHNHWPLLRPCRVELPVELPPGEREFWLRLLDSAVQTLELSYRGDDRGRTIEIADRGPRLQPSSNPGADGTAIAFSGGKDSLAQLGLLLELGERPLAVTTTSPMPFFHDHASPRRRSALEAIAARADVDHVEVRSNYRECWDNSFAHTRGYEVAVNELTDTMLYLATTMAVAWTRGANRLLLASEAEVQTADVRDGELVASRFFMFSALTQRALNRLLHRRGLSHGALTYPLHAWQVRELLWTRYRQLRTLQDSCWRHAAGENACSACSDCLKTALTALDAGVGPTRVGIDLRRLLERMGDWEPQLDGAQTPTARNQRERDASALRQLESMRTRSFVGRLVRAEPGLLVRRGALHDVRRYAWIRGRLTADRSDVPAAPGYCHDYLALIDERWRGGLERIYDSQFERSAAGEYPVGLAEIQTRIERITEPLLE